MLYFKQLLAGRHVARIHPFAGQMANFMYLIGDDETKECMVVDPAWDARGLLDVAAADGMKVVGVLATHCHPDHVGGDFGGLSIEGVARLYEINRTKLYVNKHEADELQRISGAADADMVRLDDGDTIKVGGIEIKALHTPGHSPGSQCFVIGNDYLVSGDTLFIGGCGRVDLAGGNPEQLYASLTEKLAKLPDGIVVYPGHDYGDRPRATLAEEKRTNSCLRASNLRAWRRMMG